MTRLTVRSFDIYKSYLDIAAQIDLIQDIRAVLKAAPLVIPVTPSGKPMSVRMTSAGKYGWISDRSGYRYADLHPQGTVWPDIPRRILKIWEDLVTADRAPDCCLINHYGPDAKMGLHQDKDEADLSWPVLLISLGDDGLFRMGNATQGGKTESIWLSSGDAVVMGGLARLAYHGIDRIRPGSSRILPRGGRLSLTLRVVD
ncbi:MAG: alpha-ketoglutarate-dependent dioxygenase AlkB [Rhodobacteraceae bacterium]|nr:alpha-ketoglutarate-dependent dioxygenase AlkB [Paracoccaceae bacterium]